METRSKAGGGVMFTAHLRVLHLFSLLWGGQLYLCCKQYGALQGVYKLCISHFYCTVLYLYFDVLHPCVITGLDT